MSNAQKNYLKKWALALGIIFGMVLMITCVALGEPWLWITLGIMVLTLVAMAVVVVVEIIGSMVWHWRLMGVCKTEWEEDTLRWWWRFMNYHSGCWEELIPRMIDEEYKDEYSRQEAIALFERFKAVKPPKWYWKNSEG